MLLTPTVGENKLLEFMLGVATPGNQVLRLFVNDVTPADGDTHTSYTEMSTLGYAAKTLTKTNWVVAQASGEAEGSYAMQTFTFTAGAVVSVYGYYVTDTTTGTLLWAERFASFKEVQFDGDTIKVIPKYTFARKP